MTLERAPSDDLLTPLETLARMRSEIVERWTARVLTELSPAALRHIGRDDEAAAMIDATRGGVTLANSVAIRDATHASRHRTWPREVSPKDGGVTNFIWECADECAHALGHEAGTLRTVVSKWSEESGIGEEIPRSDEELAHEALLYALSVGVAMRSLAHLVRGERGFRDEVAWQYADLCRANFDSANVVGGKWGVLEPGSRYRVYTAFDDLDGGHHAWGESWRFDGFSFDPQTCELTVRVSDGVQLDRVGVPREKLDVRPFRIVVAVGERAGHPLEPMRTLITIA